MNTTSKTYRLLKPFRECIVPGEQRRMLRAGFKEGFSDWLHVIALTPFNLMTFFAMGMVGATIGLICLFNSCLINLPEPLHSTVFRYIAHCVEVNFCLGIIYMGIAFAAFGLDSHYEFRKYFRLSLVLLLAAPIAGFFHPLSNDLAKVSTRTQAVILTSSGSLADIYAKKAFIPLKAMTTETTNTWITRNNNQNPRPTYEKRH